MAQSSFLLDPLERKGLDGLRPVTRRTFHGAVRGERLTRKRGISIEFADYRDYTDGDDLRHLDWNVLARLETPVIKTYQDEEDLAVHLLVDFSASMSFGDPSKAEVALKLASAVGYVALGAMDAVRAHAMGLSVQPTPVLRRHGAYPKLDAWLRQTESEGRAGLAEGLRRFVRSRERAGLAYLITDGLDPEAPDAIRTLGGRGHEVHLLHVLAPEDLDPDIEGDLRLIDSESGAQVEITANASALRQYRERLAAHNARLEEEAVRAGGRYKRVLTDRPIPQVVGELRKEGWFAR